MKKSILSLVLFLMTSAVQASPVLEFEGVFRDVDKGVSEAFTVGDKFNGRITINETAENVSTPPVNVYENSVNSFVLNSKDYSALGTNGDVILDLEDWPYFEINSIGDSIKAGNVNGNKLNRMSISWDPEDLSYEADLFSNDGMLIAFPEAIVKDMALILSFGDEYGAFVSGDLTSVNIVQTPIPGAVWLMGSGLVGLIGFSKKRVA